MTTDFFEHVEQLQLVDHHVHSIYSRDGDEARFQNLLNEASAEVLRHPESAYDSQIGFALRRWCAEQIDLEAHVAIGDYVKRRSELGEKEIARRMTAAAGVSHWLIDTGLKDDVLPLSEMAPITSGATYEILRLEALAQQVIATVAQPADYANAFRAALADRKDGIVGVKSVIAYRIGFNHDLSRPTDQAVETAAGQWRNLLDTSSDTVWLADPTLISFGIHCAVDERLPLQLHTGFGDSSIDNLMHANPLYLTDFLRNHDATGVPVLLVHCYPYEREAGYLAQAFDTVYMDVGLATNYIGAQSPSLLARSFELAPFGKLVYSSDAVGCAELHYLGARLWRNALKAVVGEWVRDGDWSAADAIRVATLVGRDNALRVYGLGEG